MKKIKFTLLAVLTVFTFFIVSCSDDNPSNPPGGDDNPAEYFKLEVGNWWIYQTVSKDTSDNAIEGTTIIDTTRVIASLEYEGKNSFMMTSAYQEDGESYIDTTYSAVEGSKLYLYMDNLGNDQLLVPFNGWLLYADFNQTSWTTIDTTITDQDVDLGGGLTGKLSATIKLSGENLGKTDIFVKGRTVEAYAFKQIIDTQGSINVGFEIPLNQKIEITFYFAKDIGMAKSYQPATKMIIPNFGAVQIEGSEMILLDYFVN